MQNPPATIHYNPRGYEAVYDPASDSCIVTVRGVKTPDGKIAERGGPSHPDDKPIATFALRESCAAIALWRTASPGAPCAKPCPAAPSPVCETFQDTLLDRRDLLGAPVFRNQPKDALERRLFALAYDAAQKVRSGAVVLGAGRLLFMLAPGLFAPVDCLCRDRSGAFWLMQFTDMNSVVALELRLAAYVLEAGEYVPANTAVRLGVWTVSPSGPRFAEVSNDRIVARDAVIAHLMSTPF